MTYILISALLLIFPGLMPDQDDSCAPSGWPLQDENIGRITSGRGWRPDPFTGIKRFHKGIDISAELGTPVIATMGGEVQFVGTYGSHGNTIKITCGEYTIVYAQLSEILVGQGNTIERGQVIGKVGSSGRSTHPHLHYEVWDKGKDVNPKTYLAVR